MPNIFVVGVTGSLAWELPYNPNEPYRKRAELLHRRIDKPASGYRMEQDIRFRPSNYRNSSHTAGVGGSTRMKYPATYHRSQWYNVGHRGDVLLVESTRAAWRKVTYKMIYWKYGLPLLLICAVLLVKYSACYQSSLPRKVRVERALVYPNKTVIQYILGAGMPVDLKDETVAVGHILKASYLMPSNASAYTRPTIVTYRKKRSFARWDIYEILSRAADLYGFGGKACLLRTICELADAPIDKSSGLLGELLHVLFTPTTTTDPILSHSDNEYYAAHQIGKEINGRCRNFFPECKVNFADLFSKQL
ncbi:hypothetical protein Trydic_g19181 [Trypoxylus dichotomus]